MIKVCIEGWRKINHSYSIVNHKQIIEFSKLPIYLRHSDVDFPNKNWNELRNFNGFSDFENNIVDNIKKPKLDEKFDIVFRISFPYNFEKTLSNKLFVFGTSEYQNIEGHHNYSNLIKKISNNNLNIITPSKWSKEGFINSGFNPNQISIVPHGVDFKNFYQKDDNEKTKIKNKLRINKDDFVILNIGAMTENKGIDILLVAFFLLRKKYKNIKLILKDQSNLFKVYASQYIKQMKNSKYSNLLDEKFVRDIILISENLTVSSVNDLYNIADCYVSPYRAEGFNMTPLEAAACGTPIIVTKGGSTDDYFKNYLGLQIESKINKIKNKTMLEPNLDSLMSNISEIYYKKFILDKKKSIEHINLNYNWSKIATNLIDIFNK
jgi:glycosyltransferase involved in cell wall biosynthesis